jgi:hypothetical protein
MFLESLKGKKEDSGEKVKMEDDKKEKKEGDKKEKKGGDLRQLFKKGLSDAGLEVS